MTGVDMSYWPVAVLSCFTFLVLFQYISPLLSKYFCIQYNDLSDWHKIDWNMRINSTVHSLLVSAICLYTMATDSYLTANPILGDAPLVRINTAIVAGYLLQDLILLARYYNELGDIGYVLHHLASIYAFYFVMTYGVLPWYANFRLLAELSTPFVNHRWFLDVINCPRTSVMFLANGVLMTLVFFLCRILTIPIYWHRVWAHLGTPAAHVIGNIWFVLLISCVVLDTLNVFWMRKILYGVMKVLWRKYGWFSFIYINQPVQQEGLAKDKVYFTYDPSSNGDVTCKVD